jgi:hypothetical protein
MELRLQQAAQRTGSEFFSSAHGPARDHVVAKAGDSVKLHAAAMAKQQYRSSEQRYNDKRQATGFQPNGPLAFGEYEVGRSSMPKHCEATWQFKNKTPTGADQPVYHHPDGCEKVASGDPGAYEPFAGTTGQYSWSQLADRAGFTHNYEPKAFNSTETRDIGKVRGLTPGRDTPGPGAYSYGKSEEILYHQLNPMHSIFRSKSPQRPTSHTTTPNAGAYHPNFDSVEEHRSDGGASFRSSSTQAHRPPKSMTGEALGPGVYSPANYSLQHNLGELLKVQSRKKPGFGAGSPQRQLPFEFGSRSSSVKSDTPGPGDYQPTVWTGARPGKRAASAGRKAGADGR